MRDHTNQYKEGSHKSSIGKPERSKNNCANINSICNNQQCKTCLKKIQDTASNFILYKAADLIIYSYHGVDGFNLSYSLIKCLLKVASNSQVLSADMMHDFLLTPEGIISGVLTSTFFVLISLAVACTDEKNKNQATDKANNASNPAKKPPKKAISEANKDHLDMLWRCIRGIVKTGKNTIDALRTIAQLVPLCGGSDISFLLLPGGLVLGLIAVLNRLWILHMQDQRKKMKKNNEAYLKYILETLDRDLDAAPTIEKKFEIQRQSQSVETAAMLAEAFGGLMNSAYLYMGFLVGGLSAVIAWPVFVTMLALCVLYSALHVITSLYAEYDYQRDRKITEVRVELGKIGLEIKKTLEEDKKPSAMQIKRLKAKHEELKKLTTLSAGTAFLYGLFNGLAVYRAFAGVAALALLISAALPPAFLVACMSIGVVCLLIFSIHATAHYAKHRAEQAAEKDALAFLSSNSQEKSAKINQLTDFIKKETDKPAEQLYVKDGAEATRLAPSGASKGIKVAQSLFGKDPAMLPFTILSAIFQAIILPLRYIIKAMNNNQNPKKAEEHKRSEPPADDSLNSRALAEDDSQYSMAASTVSGTRSPDSTPPRSRSPSPDVSPTLSASPNPDILPTTSPSLTRSSSLGALAPNQPQHVAPPEDTKPPSSNIGQRSQGPKSVDNSPTTSVHRPNSRPSQSPDSFFNSTPKPLDVQAKQSKTNSLPHSPKKERLHSISLHTLPKSSPLIAV